jgi:F0F1-type ATP synthase membrane subunit b/b'
VSDGFYESLAVWSQVVASLLFIVAMIVIWVKFIAPAVLASQARKNAELLDSERRRDEAKAEAEKAQAAIAEADADALAIRERAQADAARLHEKIISEGIAEGNHLMHNAEGELERSRAAAREQLRTELLERALAIARESAATLDDGTNTRLVGEAIVTAERTGGTN